MFIASIVGLISFLVGFHLGLARGKHHNIVMANALDYMSIDLAKLSQKFNKDQILEIYIQKSVEEVNKCHIN